MLVQFQTRKSCHLIMMMILKMTSRLTGTMLSDELVHLNFVWGFGFKYNLTSWNIPGRVAQSVTCLATDARLTADPGVASSNPAQSHTFVEIDLQIISTVRVVVSYKPKYVHSVLVNCLFKLAQEKVWLGELTVQPWPQLLTLDIKQQNKTNKQNLLDQSMLFIETSKTYQ